MEAIKEIPYGMSNFTDVIEQNRYYVDKTMYLPLLEDQANYLIFIRPRRFGKSLFLDMLRSYYDLSRKNDFQKLFGDLWIGKHPTPLQGKYQILYLDFSKIGGSIDELSKRFDAYSAVQLDEFLNRYREYYDDEFAARFLSAEKGLDKLHMLDARARRLGYPLYLIIDEYDNFTNVVLNEQGNEIYHAITHASGFYRDAFKNYKGMFDRIFMTGVSPVTLDDLTSGFNIGWNISTSPFFNGMLGFSEEDVRTMLRYYQEKGKLQGDVEEMIQEMKPWYDNYCFAEESLDHEPKMFNCDMVLYYLRNRIQLGKSPKQMIDPNTKTDYSKMKKLIQLDRLDGNRKGVLRKITEEGKILTNLFPSFSADELTKPEIFPSLLFYYGMLTIIGTRGNLIVLGIPNNNVRKQYYEYLLEDYQKHEHINLVDVEILFNDMAFDGDWRPALDFIARAYKDNSSVRSSIEGERNIQGFFTAYLSINAYYLTMPEVELNHGFCDMFLMPDLQRYPEVEHSYILELKYLPKEKFEAQAEEQWDAAVQQIHGYAEGEKVRQLCRETRLHCIVMQFCGWELARMEEV
ncbi:ATP-binding protein [Phocaeicola sartorii]|uniref:ATP-binding protein n=1 Tax=Phocaeicola sartorii TaxID=671267 RepID=UPI001F596A74|nr:ATP-binding protein [Phocaeicola sartorii]